MATAGNGRAFEASVDLRFRALEDGLRQMRERYARPQQIPRAASGGVVGQAELIANSVIMRGGSVAMDYEAVTYGAPSDPNSGNDGESNPAVGSWLSVSGHEITLAPGWYIPVLYLRLIWASQADAPAAFRPYIQGGNDAVHNDVGQFPGTLYQPGMWGLVAIVNHGPTYMPSGARLWAECGAVGSVGGDSDPVQSALVWDITKLT